MSSLVEEIRVWNTPILGSYILWRFTRGYAAAHDRGLSPVLILHFLAVGILTNTHLSSPISNKRKNLSSYVRCFTDKEDIDLFLSIQNRVDHNKEYTLRSVDLAIQNGLVVLNTEDARVYPKEPLKKSGKGMAIKASVKSMGNKAEVLGKWFSEYSVDQVASMLKVVL